MLFRAIGKFFRSIAAVLTGKIDDAANDIGSNHHAIKAEYDQVIHDKKSRLQQSMDAVAEIKALEKKNEAKLERLTEELEAKHKLMKGAAAMAKKTVTDLKNKGLTDEEIRSDETVLKCQQAYGDFKGEVDTLEADIARAEKDDAGYEQTLKKHKLMLQQLQRELASIEKESKEAVADVISAQERKKAADMISSIADDSTSERLQSLRDRRLKMTSAAEVSEELAGTDTKVAEAEFLEFAAQSEAGDEFDSLIGLGAETEKKAVKAEAAPAVASKELPEV